MRPVEIGGRAVGAGLRCFVIAEAGVNHNGDPDLARRLVDAACQAGADAVKFQTFSADALVAPAAPKASYQLVTTAPDESQREMIRRLELSFEAFRALAGYCRQRGITFLSTPFDEQRADWLEALAVPAFKIGSGDLTNLPLLEHVARLGRPIVLSTGMSYLHEVAEAVRAIRDAGNDRLVLLHCVSQYPARPEDANLRAMATLESAFGVPVGFSDHTLGVEVAVAAVAMGACVIEKHLTLDRSLPGPDHRVSLEPGEFSRLVAMVRNAEAALGSAEKRPVAAEEDTRRVARRSLHLRVSVDHDTPLEPEMLVALRPAGEIAPGEWRLVVGHRLRQPLPAGTQLTWSDIA